MSTCETRKRNADQLDNNTAFPLLKRIKTNAIGFSKFQQNTFFSSQPSLASNKRKIAADESQDTKKAKFHHTNPGLSLGGENAVFNNFQIKRFADGATPIAYKEGQVNGLRVSTSIIHKIIERRTSQLKPPAYQGVLAKVLEEGQLVKESTYKGLSLIKLANDSWAIHDAISSERFQPVAGQTYIFVTMPDKTIRVADSSNGHALLSNNARYIRFAGEVVFDEQQRIAGWNNQSGGYYPAPFLAHQAGFADGLARFNAKYDRNEEKQRHLTIDEPALRASR